VTTAADQAAAIVLTYRHAGTERLRSLLTMHRDLACTSGTGILPLCEQAAATWRGVEGRADARLSPLAASSIRALTMPVITTVLARQGGRRWCEFVTAPPRAAEAFLQMYPGTRVLCLHRSCADVIDAAIHADPWGLAGPEYAPFTAAYPASTVAALTAYWTARTAPLIAFEESHPDACRRVRYEDLADDPYPDGLFAFLGMEAPRPSLADQASPADAPPPDGRAPFPADQVPAPLLTQADGLAGKLGYPPLAPDR
jgi:Sulfotransferase family